MCRGRRRHILSIVPSTRRNDDCRERHEDDHRPDGYGDAGRRDGHRDVNARRWDAHRHAGAVPGRGAGAAALARGRHRPGRHDDDAVGIAHEPLPVPRHVRRGDDRGAKRRLVGFGDRPDEGLLAYFPLDGDPPTEVISGNEAGTSGSPTTDATGIVDGAFGFGGDGDYLTLPEFAPGDGGVTVSVWINADNWGGVSSLVFWGGPVPDHTSIELWVDGETPGFFYWTQRLSTG